MFARLLALFRPGRPMTSGEVGAYWERRAARALKAAGLRIVTRNWHGQRGELDIVALDGPVMVFVEVRARSAAALVGGYASINRHKRDILRETCHEYMRKLRSKPQSYRFDVVEISFRSRKDFELLHHRNVRLFS